MIKGISSSGRYIQVNGSGASTYVNSFSGQIGVGNIRFNTNSQNMEVYDGNNWQTLNMDHVSVGLNGEAESLLDWARQEREKQRRREVLIRNNPALQKAYEAIKRAEENFDLLEKFVEYDHESEQVQSSP